MSPKTPPAPRTLQEWMERHQVSAKALVKLVKAETGRDISESMMSFILRGSRRCSRENAWAIHSVTKVPVKALTKWPRIAESDKASGERQNTAA